MLTISTFVSIVFPKIVSVISLIGSVASVVLGFVLPGVCYVKAAALASRKGDEVPQWKVGWSKLIAAFATVLGSMSLLVTILSIVRGTAN